MDSPFLEMLGVEVIELRRDWCVLELDVRPQHCNRRGTLHGGMISALLDAACVYAAITVEEQAALAAGATVMLSINFTSEAQSGTRIRAEATVERRGRSISFCSGRLLAADGDLIAASHCSVKVARVTVV
jgi:uncharacterized protein (TIGR00369 family)